MRAYAAAIGIPVVALCATVGCPQLKDDDFKPRGGVGDGGTTRARAGTTGGDGVGGSDGGSSACNAGSGGCRAGAGAGGASGSPQVDSGTVPEPTPAVCGLDEVTAPNGVCYFIDSSASTWAEARARCQARGTTWDLVTINDATRNDFVLSITGFEAWIGATDVGDEGAWLWVDEDVAFFEVNAATNARFANWSDGEPNDYEDSDCLRMLTTGQWADWPCDSLLGNVCRSRPP